MGIHRQHGGGKQAELLQSPHWEEPVQCLYGTYTVALHDFKAVLKPNIPAGQSKPKSAATQEDDVKEARWRIRHSTEETAPISKKSVPTTVSAAVDTPPKEVSTRNLFAPLRTCNMATDSANTESSPSEATAPAKTGRPPPITLTSAVNLVQLQKQLKRVVRENFEFHSTRIITRSMADFQIVRSHFDSHNLSYYSFFPKSEKPIKAVIRHLPHNTPAEDISDGRVSFGFDVVSVKQMTATRRSPPEESKIINQYWWESQKERDHWEDQDVGG
jgi:hypothetical protein